MRAQPDPRTPHRGGNRSAAHMVATGALALAAVAMLAAGCSSQAQPLPATVPNTEPRGDVEAGRVKVVQYGCASCHAIPGVASVEEGVGPDLDNIATRLYLAGQIPNRPEEFLRWIRTPQDMVPGTLMPNTPMSDQDARDIAAFLYEQ